MFKLKKSNSNLDNSLIINDINFSKIIINEQKPFNKQLKLNNKKLSSMNIYLLAFLTLRYIT